MRLTLRTLLAYMDDRLPPENARELGQKVANSPFATELVERIREVKRRRRLAMPEKPVAMIDANLVAEYLDDQLTPELVARVEKEVLASDAMLAEVASAHEILGMLSDPVTIEPQLRDRLYSLDPTGRTDVANALGADAPAKVSTAKPAGEWKPLAMPGQSTRRMPIFIVAALGLIWLATVVSDSVLFRPNSASTNVAENAVVQNEAAAAEEVAAVEEVSGVPSLDAPHGGDSEEDKADSGIVVADIERAPAGVPAPEPEAEPVTSVTSEVDKPTVTIPSVVSTAPPAGQEEVMPAAAAEEDTKPVHFMTNNKTFLVFDEPTDRWMRLDQIPGGEVISTTRNTTDCRSLFKRRWFAIAEPFTAQLIVEDSGCDAMLAGMVLARLVTDPAANLEFYAGRLRLSADTAQPWSEENPSAFSMKTGGVTSTIVLQSNDAEVAIEVTPIGNDLPSVDASESRPESAATLLHLRGSDSQVFVKAITGQVVIRLSGVEQEFTLTTGKGLSWLAPGATDPARVSSTPENITVDGGNLIAAVPAWLHADTKLIPEAETLNAQLRDALASGDDPALAVLPLLADRNPQLGVSAIRILTATHDVERLLSALFENLDEAVHRAAIDGLSYIANGSADGRRTIRRGLETRIPMSEVDITVSLIEGFGDAEARDAVFCQSLIDLLNNDRLATRTLAFYRIQQYSNDRLGYQPEAELSRRRDAIRRWQKFLDRNGGKLLL
ncbi:MAG: hypothetical protein KDB01_10610 [Planctomycetaceae bacterium]|nr:hypothetical protein [Planctomycetaceae bacterium]